ncbi:MAG TPA: SH3 domain-containing protein [Pyrinomonadaceae bacterium]|nr:SH3 domain-containing protein [Pyrinomonadaceae bacterium]
MAQGTVIPSGLNLRATPGGTIMKVLPQGTTVEILEDQGNFLKVSVGSDVGFVAASFINRNAAQATDPPAVPATTPNLNLAGLAGKIPDAVLAQIPAAASEFNITSNLRLAHFLAQCALESMNFTATVENLNYSAQRLLQVFPKYFKNVDVNAYARNPQKIGSRVYANRMGNGDEASGDGFRYRGRGYIQLTGKNNYTSFTGFVGEDCVANPDLVATKFPLASAAFFFNSNNIWAICDQGASDAVVTSVTKRVNGGTHGLAERIQNFKKFRAALGA